MTEYYIIKPAACGNLWRVVSSCGNQVRIASFNECVHFCERMELTFETR